MPSKRRILPPMEVLTYADDMNKDGKRKKEDCKVRGTEDW